VATVVLDSGNLSLYGKIWLRSVRPLKGNLTVSRSTSPLARQATASDTPHPSMSTATRSISSLDANKHTQTIYGIVTPLSPVDLSLPPAYFASSGSEADGRHFARISNQALDKLTFPVYQCKPDTTTRATEDALDIT